MRHIVFAWIVGAAVAAAIGCSSTAEGDSETHWLKCRTTADCHGGDTCVDERCTPEGGSADAAVPAIINPSGACVAPDSGARAGYSTPEPGTVWLPDCQNPLKREYYRVYARSATSAYILPRPDSAFELVLVCNDPGDPLRSLVDRYGLCDPLSDPAAVGKLNSMPPADALALTHYMHTRLFFEVTEGIPNVNLRPFPIPSDVLDACKLHPTEMTTDLVAECDAERAAVDSGIEGPTFSLTGEELAKLLNELYGAGA